MAWAARICAVSQDTDRRRVIVEYLHESGCVVARESLSFNRDVPLVDIRTHVIERGERIREAVLTTFIGTEVTF